MNLPSPRRHAEADVSLETFFTLSDEAKAFARNRLVALAYARMPDLTDDERRLARDKALAAECSLWRVRYREMEREQDSQKRQVEWLENHVARLTERVQGLIAGLSIQVPESSGAVG